MNYRYEQVPAEDIVIYAATAHLAPVLEALKTAGYVPLSVSGNVTEERRSVAVSESLYISIPGPTDVTLTFHCYIPTKEPSAAEPAKLKAEPYYKQRGRRIGYRPKHPTPQNPKYPLLKFDNAGHPLFPEELPGDDGGERRRLGTVL